MRKRLGLLFLLILIVHWAGLGNVAGRPPLPAELPEERAAECGKLYSDGLRNLEAGSFRAAVRDFEEVARLAETPSTKYLGKLAAGVALLEEERFKEAAKVARTVRDDEGVPEGLRIDAALLLGAVHWEEEEQDKALATWVEAANSVDDEQPAKVLPLLQRIIDAHRRRGEADLAHQWRVRKVQLERRANPNAAAQTMERLLRYAVRIDPSLQRCEELYTTLRGFGVEPLETVPEEPAQTRDFWTRMRRLIRRFDDFGAEQPVGAAAPHRKHYFATWAEAMEGRFPEWDDFQIDRADFLYAVEQDREKWFERLNRQFRTGAPTVERIVHWIRLYKDAPERLEAFCAQLDIDGRPVEDTVRIVQALFEYKPAHGVARRVFARLDLDRVNETSKLELARFLWHRAPDMGRRVCEAMENRRQARMELLRFFHWRRNSEEGIPVANKLLEDEYEVDKVRWMLAELLEWAKRYEEAAAMFLRTDNRPNAVLRAAGCQVGAEQQEQAVRLLEGHARNDPQHAVAYLAKAADIAKNTDQKEKHREILKKIVDVAPNSKEATEARQSLAEQD